MNASSFIFYLGFSQGKRYFLDMHARHTKFSTTFSFSSSLDWPQSFCVHPGHEHSTADEFPFFTIITTASPFQNAVICKDYINGTEIMIVANPWIVCYIWLPLTEKDTHTTRWQDFHDCRHSDNDVLCTLFALQFGRTAGKPERQYSVD